MNIGFIGAGNMGGAIIRGYTESAAMKAAGSDAIYVYDNDAEKVSMLTKAGLPVNPAASLEQLADVCEILMLCIKPNIMDEVLDNLAKILKAGSGNKLIISIAAGISIGHIKEKLGPDTTVIRVMPNTPAMVGCGMSAMSAADNLPDVYRAAAEKLFSSVGMAVWVPEEMMDIVTGISGSSPAYAYLYIEGLANAGMERGLSKEAATMFAAQSTLGAAYMVIENIGEIDPRQLCVNVCSPGGTTIEAVKVLEAEGFTETVKKAALASADKSKLMTK
jgi:pyrroline-5-carboxylate reductase